ncbi:MAG: right-handed parallel beta-helix repeat-containing protein [Gemmatimonadetes bacterium]|nr:right-handed parallel beta-helix repeat-containing protein [Gemmatimonadota bacterium]
MTDPMAGIATRCRLAVCATLGALVMALHSTAVLAHEWIVAPDGSGDAATIQEAVDLATDGDTLILGDGVFRGEGNRGIEIVLKWIGIRSESGDPSRCVIDCEGVDRAFLVRYAGGLVVLEGLGIRNGLPDQDFGGAIACVHTEIELRNCDVRDCTAWQAGACHFQSSEVTIEKCVFARNQSTLVNAGALLAVWSNLAIRRCTIVGTGTPSSEYGAITVALQSHAEVIGSLVTGTTTGRGVWVSDDSDVTLSCTDLFGNQDGDWVGPIADQADVSGNFSADPLFCDSEEYEIAADSPCAPPGITGCGPVGAKIVGCGPLSIEELGWARVKAFYR